MNDSQLDKQYETFSKVIYLYFEHHDRKELQFDAFFKSQGYEIDRVFNAPDSGFQALALRSIEINRSPVLIFQGRIDCNRVERLAVCVSNRTSRPDRFILSQFLANKKSIQDWLIAIVSDRQLNPHQLKPDITSIDLNVALNQLISSDFLSLIGTVKIFQSVQGDDSAECLCQPKTAKELINHNEVDRSTHHFSNLDPTHQIAIGTSSDWYSSHYIN